MDQAKNEILNKYRSVAYPITLLSCDEGGYVAKIEDLPGCMTQGENLNEVVSMIDDAKMAWIEAALTRGLPIPEPRAERRDEECKPLWHGFIEGIFIGDPLMDDLKCAA